MPMPQRNRPSVRRLQGGASLLEVLIAVLVLAIGLLGLAAMSAMTLKNSNSSAARSQATMQVYSLFDTLRLDRGRAAAGAYNVSVWTCAAAADPDSGVDYSVFNGWLGQVQASLGDPEACGQLVCSTASCTAGIKWDDSRGTAGSAELEISITSRL